MPSRYQPVCRCQDIADPGSYEFELVAGDKTITGFVVHWQGQWYAYRNSCPHTGVSLNWLPHQFLDAAQEYIQCGLHGALFQPQDGLCIYGPCAGRSLTSLSVLVRAGEIVLDCSSGPGEG